MDGSDVLVVGAGIVGASTARFLAERGVSVTILDAHDPAWGASGRNPGFVWLHTRAAGTQMELARAGRELYGSLVEELDDFEFRPSGGMTYFFQEQAEVFPAFVDERRAAGLPMELLDPSEARDRCPALPEDIAGSTWNPLDAHIRTGRLVEALVVDAERRGAKLERDARVQRIDVTAGRATGVTTDAGRSYGGSVVVVATGAWTPALLEPLGVDLPISAMRLQVAETEPTDPRFGPVLYGPTAIKQYAFVRGLPGFDADRFTHPLERAADGLAMLELVAQRADGHVLLGCPMDYPGPDDRATVAGLALTFGVLGERFPALAGLAVERTWAGLLPETPDALPILGLAPWIEGLALATGHVFGNVAGPISGKLLAQVLTGERPDLDLGAFAADRPSLTPTREAPGRW
jgi:glycine/D-amino acid oxidase-like deaminating enzyme